MTPIYTNGDSVDVYVNDPFLPVIQHVNSAIKATTGKADALVSSAAFADARMYYTMFYVPRGILVSGVYFYQVTQGAYTGDGYNGVGLYSSDGTTLTLLASTANDADFWKTAANTWVQEAFSSSVYIPKGVYAVAALWNNSASTTAPAIGRATALAGTSVSTYGGSAPLTNGLLDAQASLPATAALSSFSGDTNTRWFGLY